MGQKGEFWTLIGVSPLVGYPSQSAALNQWQQGSLLVAQRRCRRGVRGIKLPELTEAHSGGFGERVLF